MDLAAVHSLYDALKGDELALLFSGSFQDEYTARLIGLGEELLAEEGPPRTQRNRLVFLMVEAYQNIVRHRAPLDGALSAGAGRSMFLLRHRTLGSEVVSINAVPVAEEKSLQADLDRLAGLSRQQLKDMFLSSLQGEGRTVRGGAGLGFIEMARRSGQPLRHAILPLDVHHRLFVLQTRTSSEIPHLEEGALKALHGIVAHCDLVLFCKGIASQATQEALLRMVEQETALSSRAADQRSRAFLAAMELLRSPQVSARDPLVAMGGKVSGLVVGGLVEGTIGARLAAEVDSLNAMDPGTLQQRYRDALLQRGQQEGGTPLGLLDLARHRRSALRHARYPMAHGELFLLDMEV